MKKRIPITEIILYLIIIICLLLIAFYLLDKKFQCTNNPLVYGVTTFDNNKKLLDKAEIKLLEEGFMVGPHALILKECIAKKVNNLTLLAQSHPQYPDPGAAAATVNSINKLLDLNVDVNKLLEQAEEIRLKTRELMQRTAKSLKGMEKVQEQELPVMYG